MAKKKPSNALPKVPYETHYSMNEPSKAMRKDGGEAFNPKKAKTRSTTHKKINDEDY